MNDQSNKKLLSLVNSMILQLKII